MKNLRIILCSHKGFTLVEMMVSAFLLILVFGIFLTVLNMENTYIFTNADYIDLQQQARLAMEGMTIELRQTTVSGGVTITNGGEKISFNSEGDPISYYLDAIHHQIIREYPTGTTRVVANNISALSFSATGSSVVINLTASKTSHGRTLTFFLAGKVTMRN